VNRLDGKALRQIKRRRNGESLVKFTQHGRNCFRKSWMYWGMVWGGGIVEDKIVSMWRKKKCDKNIGMKSPDD
jgi:hypothetical protein